MSKVFSLVRRDLRHVLANPIALVVLVGLVAIPSLYAWFNIAGSWDPYGNTGNVQVALANTDDGYEGGIIPFRVNVGERVVSSLAASDKIDYVVTGEDEAVEGVRAGTYYAAVIIPRSFTQDLMSVLSNDATHPEVRYYVNEKRNAIASIVAGKASDSVKTLVNRGFAEVVTEIAAGVFEDLADVLDDEGLMEVAAGLANTLGSAGRATRRTASDIEAYQRVLTTLRQLVDTSGALLDVRPATVDVSGMLDEAARGAAELADAASQASGEASSAIEDGRGALTDVEGAIDHAFEVADAQADRIEQALDKAAAIARERRDRLQEFLDLVTALNGDVASLEAVADVPGRLLETEVTYAHTVSTDLTDIIERTSTALTYLNELIDSYDRTMADLDQARADAKTSRQELKDLGAEARAAVDAARTSFDADLSSALGQMLATMQDASAEALSISSALSELSGELQPLMVDATGDLERLEGTLGEAVAKLNQTADTLDGLGSRLAEAVGTGDLSRVRTIIGSDPEALASFVSAPVELDREAFFPIENNGSAMAPYYTTMALWVGGTLMGILLFVSVSEAARREVGAKDRHVYLARLALFLLVGFLQSTLLVAGDVFYLGVQCESLPLFLLSAWLASAVFINIIFALASSFGDVGKAVAVLLMVVQVAGSGGTFPKEMLPAPFQMLYPYMPFVHSETAMRAALFGTYGSDWARAMAALAAFLIPALLLGLVLRKPFVPLTRWVEERLEETKLM